MGKGPPMMLAMDAVDEPAEPQNVGIPDEEILTSLLRQHFYHHNKHGGTVPQALVDAFDAAYPRTGDSISSKGTLLNEFDCTHDTKGRSILEEILAQKRVQGTEGAGATDRKFDFNADATSIDVNGLRVSDSASSPFAAVARLDDLDLINALTLGRGASGSVVLATHLPTGIKYAVKEIALTPETIEHAQSEVSVVWGTSRDRNVEVSPFLIHCYGVFYRDIRLYIIMEAMAASVIDLIKPGPMSEMAVKAVMFQTLHGLYFMHEKQNQLHRDIKPHNLLISMNGVVKVSDFGISSKKMETVAFKQMSTFCGTLTYMSPGRAAGENYGYEGDLWSLGVSAIQLLTGTAPTVGNVYHVIQFAQNPPRLPQGPYSPEAADFVALTMQPVGTPTQTAAQLLQHPWFHGMTMEQAQTTLIPLLGK